jgi:arylsulfatase A-like enzyme
MLNNKDEEKYPDIIILVLDAVRARNLSCYGYERKTSPNLDEFAKKNVMYKNAISTSSWTLPSVTSIFTGLMPSEHGILNMKCRLTKHETIASKLKNIGYETVAFSNVGWVTKFLGLDKGFDKFFEFDKYNLPKNLIPKYIELAKSTLSIRDYGAEIVNNKILQWLETRKKTKPYFLYVHYVEPHFPYNPHRPFHNKFGNILPWHLFINNKIKKNEFPDFYSGKLKISKKEWNVILNLYDGEIAYLDHKVGEILNFIQNDNKLMFITADHGECLSDRRDLPVLQHQFGLYDDLIKVPLLVKYPEERNSIIENQVQLSDIYATIFEVVDYKKRNTDKNLLIKEEEFEKSQYAISEYIPPENMLRRIDSSDVGEKYKQSRRAYRTNKFKYIESKKLKEFFDLKDDPLEYNNLYSHLNDVERKELKQTLERNFFNVSNHKKKLDDIIRKKKKLFQLINDDVKSTKTVSTVENLFRDE